MLEFYFGFEKSILDFFASMHGSFFDYIVLAITLLGDFSTVWVVCGIVFLCFKQTRAMGIVVIISAILPGLFNDYVLKPLINRARPFHVIAEYKVFVEAIFPKKFLVWGGVPTKQSMPSGHSISAFGAAGAMIVFSKKFGIPALILATLIALSRVYLLVHFPTDILVGSMFGAVCGLGFAFILKLLILPKITQRIKRNKKTPIE